MSSPSLLPCCLYHVAVGRCHPLSHSSISQLYLHPVSTLQAVARSGGGCWYVGVQGRGRLPHCWQRRMLVAALVVVLACRLVFPRSGMWVPCCSRPLLWPKCLSSAPAWGGCGWCLQCAPTIHKQPLVGMVWVLLHPLLLLSCLWVCCQCDVAGIEGSGVHLAGTSLHRPPIPSLGSFHEFVIIPLFTLRAGARSSGAGVGIAVGHRVCFLG